MTEGETPLERAERHLAEQTARIAEQRQLIEQLRANEHPTGLTEMQKHYDTLRDLSQLRTPSDPKPDT